MATADETDDASAADYDVAVVGGGPSGSSAAVFTARYGLDTVVFDRGNAALPRAAFVENYPGFPAGVGIETLTDLLHDHVDAAGAAYVADMVESVERVEDGGLFRVETQDGQTVTADYVVAAAWYDGEYLRSLGGDDMFEIHAHGDGDEHEHFDPDYADVDGRTPIDGLYVVAPNGARNAQAIVAAGQGAAVARTLLEDHRLAQGYPDGVAAHYDWLRPDSEFGGEWGSRDRWRKWFHGQVGEEYDVSEEELEELRETYIDRAFGTRLREEEIEQREKAGQRRLLKHLDDDVIREYAERLDAEAEQVDADD